MSLRQRSILVTGGARGIGAATALLCAERGARLTIADVDRTGGEQVAASIRDSGGQAGFHATDVRNSAEVKALMENVHQRYERLDVLICAAGVLRGAYLQPDEFPLEDYENVMDVNVKGVFLCAKYAAPLLAASGRGAILIVASDAGIKAPSVSLAYSASKAGANGLAMTLEQHLRERNIRVNVLCPGDIDTEMRRSIIALQAQREGRQVADAIAQAQRDYLGTPEGVARVLAFLASDDAEYVRGVICTR